MRAAERAQAEVVNAADASYVDACAKCVNIVRPHTNDSCLCNIFARRERHRFPGRLHWLTIYILYFLAGFLKKLMCGASGVREAQARRPLRRRPSACAC